jgi:hypothetical protein
VLVEEFWARYDWSDPSAHVHLQQRKVDDDAVAVANANPAIESKSDSGSKKTEADTHGSDKAVAKKSETELAPQSDETRNSIGKDRAVTDSLSKSETKDKDHEAPSEAADRTAAVAVDHGLEVETEWTKQGVEEVLATTGVQCAYNTEVGRVESNPGPIPCAQIADAMSLSTRSRCP